MVFAPNCASVEPIEPWFGAFIDYTFLNETDTDGLDTRSFDEQADLRLQSGWIAISYYD